MDCGAVGHGNFRLLPLSGIMRLNGCVVVAMDGHPLQLGYADGRQIELTSL